MVDAKNTAGSGLGFAVSAAVAKPLLQAWATAPQPVAAATCPSPVPAQPTPSSTAAPPTYQAPDFSIDYPSGWQVSHIPEPGNNRDTTFQPSGGGGLLLRVDENPSPPVNTASAASAPVIAGLRHDPTYIELGLTNDTFDGVQAVRWEFEVDENGEQVHKVDEFFIDSSGRGWGVLFQAPQADWAQDGAPLQAFAGTFASN